VPLPDTGMSVNEFHGSKTFCSSICSASSSQNNSCIPMLPCPPGSELLKQVHQRTGNPQPVGFGDDKKNRCPLFSLATFFDREPEIPMPRTRENGTGKRLLYGSDHHSGSALVVFYPLAGQGAIVAQRINRSYLKTCLFQQQLLKRFCNRPRVGFPVEKKMDFPLETG